jgi:hypothetical protein
MGLRNLPSKTWVVNCGWVLAANLAADLAAWCRLLGLYDCEDLKDAEPDTLRYLLRTKQAELHGCDVVPGHSGCIGAQGQLRLT